MDTSNPALIQKSLQHAQDIICNDCSRSHYSANMILSNLLYAFQRGEFDKETDFSVVKRNIYAKLREMEEPMKELQRQQLDAASWISAVIGK